MWGGNNAVAADITCASVIRRPVVSGDGAWRTLAHPMIPTTARPAMNDNNFMGRTKWFYGRRLGLSTTV
jgi:hypothetical protein